MRVVLDTNALIYFCDDRLARPLPAGQYFYSPITEIELLSWPDITPTHEQTYREVLRRMQRVGLEDSVIFEAIRLRRAYRLKLPDAVIAATAQAADAVLLTNDQELHSVPGLRCEALELR